MNITLTIFVAAVPRRNLVLRLFSRADISILARAVLASSQRRTPPNHIHAHAEGVYTFSPLFYLYFPAPLKVVPARLPAAVPLLESPRCRRSLFAPVNTAYLGPRRSFGPQVPAAALVTFRQVAEAQPNSFLQARTSIPCAGALGSTPPEVAAAPQPAISPVI